MEMFINTETIEQEARFDGFYAYGTSLDDDAIDVLRARSFHNEIEHLFRTTKTHLDARPVFISRPDRIRSHFLVCFLSMVILKMLQKQLTLANLDAYKANPLTIDSLIATIRDINFYRLEGQGYLPAFTRTALTDQLQTLTGTSISTEIIPTRTMTANYRNVKK